MAKLIDLTGKKYNKLTVIERAENTKNGQSRWKCICECGNTTIVASSNLKNGEVKSCGCLRHLQKDTHHESKTKLYRMWKSMIYRCHNPKNQAYEYYGARGIKVCEEWHDFLKFKEWVLKTKPSQDLTIERVDVNKDYSPENCIWIPISEQANNRRSCVYFEYNGEKHNLMEWCKILNLNYKNVHNRIYKLNWSFEKAISIPIDTKKRSK